MSVEWKTANLSNLLPSEITDTLDLVRDLLVTVETALNYVTGFLDTVKNLLISFPVFDFLDGLADVVEGLKEDFLLSGMYVCHMWDYPAVQLRSVDTSSPRSTYCFSSYNTRTNKVGTDINYLGQSFESSFLADFNDSFDDAVDFNRPTFTGNVAMLMLVLGTTNLDDLNLTTKEDSTAEVWKGFGNTITDAASVVEAERWKYMWMRVLDIASKQSNETVEYRFSRCATAMETFNRLDPRTEWSAIPAPIDPETGRQYLEGLRDQDISYNEHILPIIEAVEDLVIPSSYPDWGRMSLNDFFPELVEIFNSIFDPVIDLLRSGSTIKDTVVAIINGLKAKVEQLSDLISTINEILDRIDDILDATGFNALYIATSAGIEDLRTRMLNATNSPFPNKGFYSGMILLAGGPNYNAFNTLLGPVAS